MDRDNIIEYMNENEKVCECCGKKGDIEDMISEDGYEFFCERCWNDR